ncbi:MAG: glycerol-3-phosphate 1-O-acyltransferase PlsY [Gemmataceae bacterium]
MNTPLLIAVTVVVAYLIGGIPFGWVVAKMKGVNIFEKGSGNIGATNVGRVLGRKYGYFVFVLDFLKGAGPALAAKVLAEPVNAGVSSDVLGIGAGLAAIVGHMFPVYLKFKGGKGVATGAGIVTVLVPLPFAIALMVWLGVVLAIHTVSAASLAAASALCASRCLAIDRPFASDNLALTLFCFVVAALVFVRHKGNIARLARGNENRIQETPTMQKVTKVVHVLTMGFWFGMSIFFSFFVALTLLNTMDESAAAEPRPAWFPVWTEYAAEGGVANSDKEQGSQAFGAIISPLFDWFFPLQGICGFVAVATAWNWQRFGGGVHRWRVTLLLLAIATVLLGWPLERHVSVIRDDRTNAVRHYLEAKVKNSPAAKEGGELEQRVVAVKAQFGTWHTYSLFLNFGTIGLVTVVMGMAAFLPTTPAPTNSNTSQANKTASGVPGNGQENPKPEHVAS